MKSFLQFSLRATGILLCLQLTTVISMAQLKSYTLSPSGDTLNKIDQDGLKQGKWVVSVPPLRGERGYEEEGIFIDNEKEGPWRKYTTAGDFIAMENFRKGYKDGTCQYFSPYGELLREESWRAYNPDSPYDTVAVYGTDNNEIIQYKVVKAAPYSVKHGTWTYYDQVTGRILKTEEYELNRLIDAPKATSAFEEPMKKIKPAEVIEYEKKNSGKKNVKVRDGRTGT